MPQTFKICVACDEKFLLRPDHRGKANVCLNCSGEDVPLLMAKVSYPSKHVTDAIIEITADRAAATAFNRAQRRGSAGVMTSSFRSVGEEYQKVAGKDYEPPEVKLDTKKFSGAETRALYHSNLGEKRSVGLRRKRN